MALHFATCSNGVPSKCGIAASIASSDGLSAAMSPVEESRRLESDCVTVVACLIFCSASEICGDHHTQSGAPR